MSNCSNCYNGCTEIVSDRCVKYTGIDVPVLGIQTGDSLSFVEQALITFLTSTLDGTGVKIDLAPTIICDLVKQYLPTCKDLSIVDVSKALVQAACNLQLQVNAINATLATLNADYTIGCLTGVTASSDTHAIVQAVINTLCTLKSDFEDLLIDLPNTYVELSELNTLIQSYLNSPPNNLISNKMVPFTILPYYGSLSNFDLTGAGTGQWNKIYLCNGDNGTPDLRGRVIVGAINGVPGPTLGNAVNPSVSIGNPNYALGDTMYGANQITLTEQQIPSHIHPNIVTTEINDPEHTHTGTSIGPYPGPAVFPGTFDGGTNPWQAAPVSIQPAETGITVDVTIENKPTGGNLPHSNIQPVLATYYIIYIP